MCFGFLRPDNAFVNPVQLFCERIYLTFIKKRKCKNTPEALVDLLLWFICLPWQSLPRSIGKLKKLLNLNCDRNQLTSLPKEVSSFNFN